MKRLVYSPRAFVFVRSRQEGGKIYDLTDLCVSGRIQRNVSAPSQAEFVVKNKNFILSSHDGQNPKFLPMDGVTIWLQRIAGHPIQVFTGYLDSVPLYQMYPGNATFRATCTLKRLMHSYWDPGLVSVRLWFEKYGWAEDPKTGMIKDFQGLADPLSKTGGKTTEGFGQLLRQFLIEICNWDADAVMISDLPADIGKKASKLWSQLQSQEQASQDQLADALSEIMSIRVNHDNTANNGGGVGDVVKSIYDEASNAGLDPTVLVLAALVLSALSPVQLDQDSASPTYGAGLFDALPDNQSSNAGGTHDTHEIQTQTWDGLSATDIADPSLSTKAFIKRLRGASNTAQQVKIDDNADALGTLIATASGKTKFQSEIITAVRDNKDAAKKLVDLFSHASNATSIPELQVTPFGGLTSDSLPDNLTWDQAFESNENNIIHGGQYNQKVLTNKILPYYLFVAHKYNLNLSNNGVSFVPNSGNTIGLNVQDKTNGLNYAAWVAKQNGVDHILYMTDGALYEWEGGQQTHNGDKKVPQDILNAQNKGFKADTIYVTVPTTSPRPTYVGTTTNTTTITTGQDQTGTQQITYQDIVKISMASAFATQFQLPINSIESMFLHGDKSLMNDVPVLDGVQQICKASLRNFMSLPDGRFVAFYPDYFGASGRAPYWSISDLEITNMGIQLSDDQLVTHAFVTGSTTLTNPGSINPLDEIRSQGVVTVENAFNSNTFIAGENNKTASAETIDAFKFLQVYGARPLRVDMPIIRSRIFEFLYAWQLFMYKWACQFQTRVEFTFQPEVMAGGLILFSDHNIQMYVNGVEHSWDYTSGFTTSANLVAPSLADPNGPSLPGFAIASEFFPPGIGAVG